MIGWLAERLLIPAKTKGERKKKKKKNKRKKKKRAYSYAARGATSNIHVRHAVTRKGEGCVAGRNNASLSRVAFDKSRGIPRARVTVAVISDSAVTPRINARSRKLREDELFPIPYFSFNPSRRYSWCAGPLFQFAIRDSLSNHLLLSTLRARESETLNFKTRCSRKQKYKPLSGTATRLIYSINPVSFGSLRAFEEIQRIDGRSPLINQFTLKIRCSVAFSVAVRVRSVHEEMSGVCRSAIRAVKSTTKPRGRTRVLVATSCANRTEKENDESSESSSTSCMRHGQSSGESIGDLYTS